MLCTGVCTTCALRTPGCGQPCGKPVDRKRCAKPIAAQRIGPLEISHALRSEGRNEETRDGHEAGAQVNRITDDRLDRVRSDEVLEAFGQTGSRATPRRNAGPVGQIASPWLHRFAGATRRHRRSGHNTRFAGGRGRSNGAASWGGSPAQGAAPTVGFAVTSVRTKPAGGTSGRFGDRAARTPWPTTDPLRWGNRHHTWEP